MAWIEDEKKKTNSLWSPRGFRRRVWSKKRRNKKSGSPFFDMVIPICCGHLSEGSWLDFYILFPWPTIEESPFAPAVVIELARFPKMLIFSATFSITNIFTENEYGKRGDPIIQRGVVKSSKIVPGITKPMNFCSFMQLSIKLFILTIPERNMAYFGKRSRKTLKWSKAERRYTIKARTHTNIYTHLLYHVSSSCERKQQMRFI